MKFIKTIWKGFVLRVKTFFGINRGFEGRWISNRAAASDEKISNAIALDKLPRNIASASPISAFVTKEIVPVAKEIKICKIVALTLKHSVSWMLTHLGFKSAGAKIGAMSGTLFGSACVGVGVFVVCFGLFVLLAPHVGPAVVVSKTASLAHEVYDLAVTHAAQGLWRITPRIGLWPQNLVPNWSQNHGKLPQNAPNSCPVLRLSN